jgi:3-oxoacyl-[acyl-carrier protein] reductase
VRVLVTGSASGIGEATARVLAADGLEVVGADIAGGEGVVALDVRDEEAWERVLADHGPFDALVSAAGVRTRAPLLELDLAEWERVVAINLTGTFLGIKAVGRDLVARHSPGALVTIASVNSFSAVPAQPHYVASKAGIAMLTKAAALELAPHRIRVNAIAPGAIDTPMLAARLVEPGQREWLEEQVPLGRIGEPEEIGRVVAFLLSDAAAYMTGAVVPVDGGWLTK